MSRSNTQQDKTDGGSKKPLETVPKELCVGALLDPSTDATKADDNLCNESLFLEDVYYGPNTDTSQTFSSTESWVSWVDT